MSNANIIDFKTRLTRPPAPKIEVICVDDEMVSQRFIRLFNAIVGDLEEHGMSLDQIRRMLLGRLNYIDMKIAAKGYE